MLNAFLSMTLFAAAAAVQPGPAAPKPRAALIIQPLASTAVTVTATPATISFTGTNPATAPSVAGSAQTVVSWVYDGNTHAPWNLTVSVGGPTTFGSCTTVPISAVTVTCASASLAGPGNGSAACSPASGLSTAPTQVASGTENGTTATYTVKLTFTLADSWKYIATTGQTCSLTLTYNATLQ
jgi:hypothetical protein